MQDDLPSPSSPLRRWLALGLVWLVAGVLYRGAPQGEFVYDDILLVGGNPHLQSWGALLDSLGRPYWDFVGRNDASRIAYWRPLSSAFLRLGVDLDNGLPRGLHWISLCLHALACAGAFVLARRLARSDRVAFFTALLFALHPVNTEAVAWISALSDPLAAGLTMFSLWAFLRWREEGSVGIAWLPGALFALALLSKESAVCTLLLAAALDVGRARASDTSVAGSSQRSRNAARERLAPFARAYLPLLAVLGAYYVARVAVFGSPWAGLDRVNADFGLTSARSASLRVELLGNYLRLLVWPLEWNAFREFQPVLPEGSTAILRAVLWLALWLAGLWWWVRRGARPLLAAWLWIMLASVPLWMPLHTMGRFPLSDRFLYMGSFGVAFAAAWLLAAPQRAIAGSLALVGLAALAGSQIPGRVAYWSNEEALFRASVEAQPRSVFAQWNMGRVLLEKARTQADAPALQAAFEHFSTAQDLIQPPEGAAPDRSLLWTPQDALQANVGVGNFYMLCAISDPTECTFDDAALIFEETGRRFPNSELPYNGLGIVRMMQDRLDEAAQAFERATTLAPNYPLSWYHLGQVEMRRKRWLEAADQFARALELQPMDAEILAWRATALLAANETSIDPEAEECIRRALQIDPTQSRALLQRGMVELMRGDMRQGERTLQAALKSDPRLPHAHVLLAKLYLKEGDSRRGIEALQLACSNDPADVEAHSLLGILLADNGYADDARPYLERALQLEPPREMALEVKARLERAPANPR